MLKQAKGTVIPPQALTIRERMSESQQEIAHAMQRRAEIERSTESLPDVF
jgi:hypothetical protein